MKRGDKPKSRKSTWGKLLLRVALLLLTVFVTFSCASVQRKLMYYPPVFTSAKEDEMGEKAKLVRWTNSSGATIGWKRLSAQQPARWEVLMCYGNGSFAVGCARYADAIQSVAVSDVFILEYPGYGDRPGSPTQESLFRSADEALSLLGANARICLVGESLGTGVASYLAGTYPNRVAGVILLSPYNRMVDLAQHHLRVFPEKWILADRFPSEDYLRQYHGSVGILVDGRDRVIPEKLGKRLYDGYTGPKKIWEYSKGGHTQIPDPQEQFWRDVFDFWQSHEVHNEGADL